jgi:hypothetical protein
MRRLVAAPPRLSLAISVLAHGAAALLLTRLGPLQGRPLPAEEPPVEVELLDEPTLRPPAPPPEPAPSARPPAPTRQATPPAPRPAREPAPARPAREPTPARPAREPTPAQPAREPAPAPAETASALRPRPRLTLAMDYRAVDRLTQQGVLEKPQGAAPPPPAPSGGSTFSQRLAARVRQDGARRNVEKGKVHPQVFDFMRDARKVFAPDPGTVDLDPRTPNSVKNSLKQWGGGLREAYRSWRRVLDNQRARRRDDDPDRRNVPDILEHYNRILEGNQRGAEAIASQVCLVLEPGAEPRVELGESSRNAEVDGAAVDALARAARRRQPEADLRKQRACYRFAVKVVRVPPLPVAGCMFDEVELTATCYYPLKKAMTISVSLDSVDYP